MHIRTLIFYILRNPLFQTVYGKQMGLRYVFHFQYTYVHICLTKIYKPPVFMDSTGNSAIPLKLKNMVVNIAELHSIGKKVFNGLIPCSVVNFLYSDCAFMPAKNYHKQIYVQCTLYMTYVIKSFTVNSESLRPLTWSIPSLLHKNGIYLAFD